MRFMVQIILIVALAWIAESFFPWWSSVIAAAVVGFLYKSKANFLAGFIAIALLWLIKAVITDLNAAVPLADKIAKILLVNSKILLLVLTATLGGLAGGFGALTGSLLKSN
ncbi:MAG: hypothetical protein KF725_03690 [Cyclobacteriaceae bacterium]|nr:hypothetical protein [Cyclobacteriaceae bacterium]UYN85621.1 MAG: hypothetical protein KIT51_12115 [Cyclobacteriaceae bacterium]